MPIIVTDKPLASYAAESGHWYTRAGDPAYTIAGKNGKERNTTLRDARKYGLLPGWTTIAKAAAKPGLERWKAEQLLMSALTLPRLPAESEAAWIGRVWGDSIQQAIKAAERGAEIHGAIEAWFAARSYDPRFSPYVEAVIEAIIPLGNHEWLAEKSFASPLGYGGKVDLHSAHMVLDFKTKETADVDTVELYDDHFMQLAAYAHGLKKPEARCGVVFVGRDLPARARLVMLTDEQTVKGWQMAKALLNYWQEAHDYCPTWQDFEPT